VWQQPPDRWCSSSPCVRGPACITAHCPRTISPGKRWISAPQISRSNGARMRKKRTFRRASYFVLLPCCDVSAPPRLRSVTLGFLALRKPGFQSLAKNVDKACLFSMQSIVDFRRTCTIDMSACFEQQVHAPQHLAQCRQKYFLLSNFLFYFFLLPKDKSEKTSLVRSA
jgi:hypothetical protein